MKCRSRPFYELWMMDGEIERYLISLMYAFLRDLEDPPVLSPLEIIRISPMGALALPGLDSLSLFFSSP